MTTHSDQLKIQTILTDLTQIFSAIPFNRMLGYQLQMLDAEHVEIKFDMKKELIGNYLHGILHGGVISAVLDTAGGMVVMGYLIHKHVKLAQAELAAVVGKCSTVDLQINYLRPGRGDHFLAKAQLLKAGNKIAFTRMELFNHRDALIATSSGTYLY